MALYGYSIGVSDASSVDPSSVAVSYLRADRIALRKFGWVARPYAASGWVRVHRVTVHLVRVVPPPIGWPDRRGFVSTAPLKPGDLAWLVVIRDATIPILGPPGGTYIAPLAIFVRTDEPSFVVALTI